MPRTKKTAAATLGQGKVDPSSLPCAVAEVNADYEGANTKTKETPMRMVSSTGGKGKKLSQTLSKEGVLHETEDDGNTNPTIEGTPEFQPLRTSGSQPLPEAPIHTGGKSKSKSYGGKGGKGGKLSAVKKGIKGPGGKRFKPGQLALKEIRKMQQQTEAVIPRLPFQRLVRDIARASN